MSRRGGGRGQEPRRDRPSPASSAPRGGGSGGAKGGSGGGGGRRFRGVPAAPPTASPAPSSQYVSASAPAPAPSTSLAAYQASASTPVPSQAAQASTSSKAIMLPRRPGFGTVGQKCVVRANHFLVEVADRDLHRYDVTITPKVTSKTLNRDVMTEWVKSYRESHLGKRMPAYDGRKSLYTAGPLPFTSKEFVVKLADRDGGASSSREREFRVAIKFAAKPDLHHLQQFLRGRQLDVPQETIHVLNEVLRESPSLNYTVVGRSFFSSDLGPTGELGSGLEYWKGCYQSLRPTQMGLSLNIDVSSARSFYEPILVTEFVEKYFNFRGLSRPLSDQDRVNVKKALKGIKVELTHREYAKTYIVKGVSTQPTSQLMFPLDDNGTNMSVVQYFRQKYNIVLKYAFLPALQAGSHSNPVYLPMELCRIVKGQRYSKKLSDRQVTALLRATCQRPTDRERTIKQMIRQNNYSGDELVGKEFGIQVRDELTLVDARVLPAPRLKYHDTGRVANVDPRVGQWNMIDKKMVNGGNVEFWTCVNFSQKLCPDVVFGFCEGLVNMCASKGMVFNPSPLLPIQSAHPNQIEKALSDIHSQSTAKLRLKGKQLQMLIVILPDVTGSYGEIKRVCETELGIVSQCCQPTQVQKLSMQYFENVALKMNVKVGGRNTVLSDALQRRIPLVTDVPTIIFGSDVTHPQPGEDSSPSIAAVVASMDWPEVTKYRGLVSSQHHREEIIQDLYKLIQDPQKGNVHGGLVRELLIAFRRSTGHKPHRIIFYRDGVGEGQFSQVLLHEMDAIRKVLRFFEDFDIHMIEHTSNYSMILYARCTRSISIVPPAHYAHLAAFRARYYIEGTETSDSGFGCGGRSTKERNAEVRPLPIIKDNVKDVMFYC
ncbi:hypothetical protein L1049_013286 [Liquidambar formosana]|uniref:Argonaute 5 n=1 Tax=Liquidambar formosana TaxID=63359 RepID=A0AAP0WU56_LIQFO